MKTTSKNEAIELEIIIQKSVKDAFSDFKKGNAILESEKLMTVTQVSRKLGKSFRTVKKWINSGILQTTKNGLITDAALNEYLNK